MKPLSRRSRIEPDAIVVYQDEEGRLSGLIVYGPAQAFEAFGLTGDDLKPETDHVLDGEGRIQTTVLRFGDKKTLAQADAADPAVEAGPATVNNLPDFARQRIRALERDVQTSGETLADLSFTALAIAKIRMILARGAKPVALILEHVHGSRSHVSTLGRVDWTTREPAQAEGKPQA